MVVLHIATLLFHLISCVVSKSKDLHSGIFVCDSKNKIPRDEDLLLGEFASVRNGIN
jgi:hypothetical protein